MMHQMIAGKAIQSLQVKFTKNYLYMDNQSLLVTNILLPLYSLLGGLKGGNWLCMNTILEAGALGPKNRACWRIYFYHPFLPKDPYSQFQTALPSVHSLPFLQENPNSMLWAHSHKREFQENNVCYFQQGIWQNPHTYLTFTIQKHLLNTNYASILF